MIAKICYLLCGITIAVNTMILAMVNTKPVEPQETIQQVTSKPTTVETIAPTQTQTAATQPVTEATEPPETTVATEPEVILYDVPLSNGLQLYIIGLCEEKHIDPAIILAMCFRESSYNPEAIGDNGASIGLMQIQPKWNYELMEELECLDLLDPYQNVTVGIHILAERLKWYDGDIAKALTAYNRGFYEGTVTQYALNVLATAEELRGETYVYG